jgi:hypothetical protein
MALYRRDQALQAGTDPRQRRQSYLLGARQLRARLREQRRRERPASRIPESRRC